MKNYVLDACALIAFILDEEGAGRVEKLLTLSSDKNAAFSYIKSIFLKYIIISEGNTMHSL